MSKRVKNTKSTNNAEMKKILKMSKESFKNEQKQRKLANNMDEEEEMNKVLKLSEDFYKIEEVSREVGKYLRLIEKGMCKDSIVDLFDVSNEAESMLGIKRGSKKSDNSIDGLDTEECMKPVKKNSKLSDKELIECYGSDPKMLDYDNFATNASEKELLKEYKLKAIKLLAEFLQKMDPSEEEEREFADSEGINFAEFEDEVNLLRNNLKHK